jgi:DNA-binding Lrp family transcriptional regulator
MTHRTRRGPPQVLRSAGPDAEDFAVDEIDRVLLREIQQDGRITNQALAQRVGRSPSACLARLRRLEEAGIITGYGARIAYERLGSSITIFAEITLQRHHPDDLKRFETMIAAMPEVVESAQVSGTYDYLLKVVTADVRAWGALSDRLAAAGNGVDKIASHILMKDAKRFTGYPI